MMGQELFEHPKRQYRTYNITPLTELTKLISSPEVLEDDPTEEQVEAIEAALDDVPSAAVAFDEAAGLWIRGAEEDINQMLDDREEFLDALENNQDPGI
ncbi:MAG: molecular chaperone GrpE [Corynebacterium camporealensis]|uniref:molecular chaperone GrpE n=1 Tax=Corynebacterium camporealensis TaxID=161896 RepID=UPI002A91621A|nr:molecular chaperone GrpE [Corynebacterium camporealensis]MDY5839830.1 molecular chaperone GrpE [Corynebacterium camporealensis]